ncbi:MAG: hypothetical protein A2Y10_10275 [Planctomycetes bacterium GWF2_41_51]|nr:MAG: hypothetical protein A2Y10_10275 [Planctomycetes bacterium GWF2_41_51]HBG27673.1 hypothetical protein [Phycisphaerales bacterium]
MAMPIIISNLERKKGKSRPLYQQISNQVRFHIESGKLNPGDRLPPISDLVNQCGVDYKTINLALQDLEREGLIRCELGRGKGPIVTRNSNCKYSIMFIRWNRDVLSLEISDGIQRFATQRGLKYVIVDASQSHEHVIDAIAHPIQNVNGIVMMPHERSGYSQAVLGFLKTGRKMVFVDRVLDDIPVSSVSIDHVSGAFKATKHLLGAHGLPVYYVGSTNDPSSVRDRLVGWSVAMRQHGFAEIKPYICGFSQPEHELATDENLGLKSDYDATRNLLSTTKEKKISIFAVNDNVAKGIYTVAESLGLKIGIDLYIASFGNMPLCEQLTVPLTSVMQSNELIGYEAANLLFMSLLGEIKKPVRRVLPAEVIIRASSTGAISERQDCSNQQVSLVK